MLFTIVGHPNVIIMKPNAEKKKKNDIRIKMYNPFSAVVKLLVSTITLLGSYRRRFFFPHSAGCYEFRS